MDNDDKLIGQLLNRSHPANWRQVAEAKIVDLNNRIKLLETARQGIRQLAQALPSTATQLKDRAVKHQFSIITDFLIHAPPA